MPKLLKSHSLRNILESAKLSPSSSISCFSSFVISYLCACDCISSSLLAALNGTYWYSKWTLFSSYKTVYILMIWGFFKLFIAEILSRRRLRSCRDLVSWIFLTRVLVESLEAVAVFSVKAPNGYCELSIIRITCLCISHFDTWSERSIIYLLIWNDDKNVHKCSRMNIIVRFNTLIWLIGLFRCFIIARWVSTSFLLHRRT